MLVGCIPAFFHPGAYMLSSTQDLHMFSTHGTSQRTTPEEKLRQYSPLMVKQIREDVVNLISNLIYVDPRSKLQTLKDAFDVAVDEIIKRVAKIRRDMVEGREDKDFIEETVGSMPC
ncbi:hypothetical protein LUZ63_019649 [Rhynchospora breviuscula]|uniref:Uncharacterized protein n=1 Tax=Rhynchospora breviuscula TaxID=2022672 RepID=A0A9Q0HJJ8_9POAL|nr:hypothetical protein LUZ63_019649 [Rhynchospora breviuscula]